MDQIKVNGIYKHFKGNTYRVLGVARHSESLEELVVYQHIDGEKEIWARPIAMFLDEADVDGKKVPRFQYIGE